MKLQEIVADFQFLLPGETYGPIKYGLRIPYLLKLAHCQVVAGLEKVGIGFVIS
jgi:hypothetical protein